jgi:hypothetical protein
MVTAIAAAAVVIGATYLQGRMTDRWTGRNVAAELQQSAERLEKLFPKKVGDWEAVEELESNPEELERAGRRGAHFPRLLQYEIEGAAVGVRGLCHTP